MGVAVNGESNFLQRKIARLIETDDKIFIVYKHENLLKKSLLLASIDDTITPQTNGLMSRLFPR